MSGKLKQARVLFLGGESSGKSTITELAANTTNCYYAHEYGRQFYEERPGKEYEFEDLTHIATSQVLLELAIVEKSEEDGKKFSFYDTSLIVTYFYSLEWFGKSNQVLKDNAIPVLQSYDYIFLCSNDFPFVQDGSRQSPEFSKKQFDFYKFVLDRCELPYIILKGDVQERLNTVLQTIGASDESERTDDKNTVQSN